MPYQDVTLPELARRMDRDQEALQAQLKEMREEQRESTHQLMVQLQTAATLMVTAERYKLEAEAQDKRITDLEIAAAQAREGREKQRLLLVGSFVLPIIVALVTNYLVSKGAI